MIHIKTTALPLHLPGLRRTARRPVGRAAGTAGPVAARQGRGSALVRIALALQIGLWGSLWGGPAAAQEGPQPRLPTVTLTAGMHRVVAEVARSPREQAMGLMHRREMGANDGMLFVYDRPQPLCFWMRNTLLPLTIAFIDDDGRIVNLRDMQPLDETSHCADRPVRFALEMNQGWFDRRGLKPGFRLRGGPFAP